jgi:hypothetical protein
MTTKLSATQFQDNLPKMFATVAAAQADENLEAGQVICLADRASSLWDVSSSGKQQ